MDKDIKAELFYDKGMLGYEELRITVNGLEHPITITPNNFKQIDKVTLIAVYSKLRYDMLFGDKSTNDLFKRNAIIRFLIEDLDPYLNGAN